MEEERMLMARARKQVIEELPPAECWHLLEADGVGRLATATVDPVTGAVAPDLFPVNFHAHEGAILFRSGPGSKLVDLTSQPAVAFQTDGRRGRRYWSIVVHGHAHRLALDDDIMESGILDLQATHPTEKWNYVRIDVESITGIRFRR
jgi:nitroimidazol reductase NimA-like FMN-containing flavoprotein (pyridoxamine 5'-phosphate oxidase superfamily)